MRPIGTGSSPLKHYKLVNALVYNAGWFACVGGAGHGLPWAGALAACAGLALHLGVSERPREEAQFVASAVVLGCAMDSLQSLAGTFTFRPEQTFHGLAPVWLASVWVLFATTFSGCLSFIQGRWALMALFGAVGGPLAYFAGAKLGAVTMPDGAGRAVALGAIGVAWAIAYPALGWLWARMTRDAAPTPDPPPATA